MEKEDFLIKLTSSEEEEAAATSPRLHYFNKVHTLAAAALASPAAASQLCVWSNQVLRLLEDVGLPELVIQLASLAITEAVNDANSQVSSFLSTMFSHSGEAHMTLTVLLCSGCSVDADIQTPPGPGPQWRSLRSPHAEPRQQHVRRLFLGLLSCWNWNGWTWSRNMTVGADGGFKLCVP